MPHSSDPLEIVHDGQTLGAIWRRPRGARAVLLFAHGAGQPMDSEFMEAAAEALRERGVASLRFDYPYAARAKVEGRRRPPDRAPRLLGAHRAALALARRRARGLPLFLGGKSMGGRMSSLLAAESEAAAGLVLYGYPLHPAGKPEVERTEHFSEIRMPSLFLQGTRDALCRLERLRPALGTMGAPVQLHVVEGGDHSFAVPKRSGRTSVEVHAELADAVAAFVTR